jgi:hypothetical protein
MALARTLLLSALIAWGNISATSAESLTAPAVMTKLRELGFPMGLLAKAHAQPLNAYEFNEVASDPSRFLAARIEGGRPMEGVAIEALDFEVYDYPNIAARDAAIASRDKAPETYAVNNPDWDIYYFHDGAGTRLFRIERWHGVMQE